MNRLFLRRKSFKVIGAEASPYTNKVISYLEHKGIQYETVAATGKIYAEIILPKVGWPIVPVLGTPEGQYIQDSEDIILSLEERFPQNGIVPDTPRQQLAAQLLQLYGDQYMTLPVMHYRWSFTDNHEPFIYYNFGGMMNPELPYAERVEMGSMVAKNFRKFCKPLGINAETAVDIENNYLGLLREMTDHLDQCPYFLGSQPCLGDFSIHGMIYAHLIRDPRTGFITKSNAPLVNMWCERMRGISKEHPVLDAFDVDENGELVRSNVPREFLPGDEIPATLMPILKRVVSDFVHPILLPSVKQLNEYAAKNPKGGLLPKPLMGKEPIQIQIGKTKASRLCNPFDVYRLLEAQRLIEKHDLKKFVDEIDPEGFIAQCKLNSFTLKRVDNQLHMVPL